LTTVKHSATLTIPGGTAYDIFNAAKKDEKIPATALLVKVEPDFDIVVDEQIISSYIHATFEWRD
jgi:hypothetical protein